MIELLVYATLLFVVGVSATILWDKYATDAKLFLEHRRQLQPSETSSNQPLSSKPNYEAEIKSLQEEIKNQKARLKKNISLNGKEMTFEELMRYLERNR